MEVLELKNIITEITNAIDRGAWVAQLVKRPTSAQVTISWFVSSSPMSGSVLIAQSWEPVLDSQCAPPPK